MKSEVIEEDFLEFIVGDTTTCNNNYIFLGTNGLKGYYRRLYIKCKICSEDTELNGDGIFKSNIATLRKGMVCNCSKISGQKPSQHNYKIRIERLCKEYGYTLKGYSEDKIQSSTYLKLSCGEGHYWETTSVSKFLNVGRKCPFCAGNYKRDYTEDKVRDKIISSRGYKYAYEGLDKVKNNRSKFTAICPVHGAWITDLYHHTNRKQDCPHEECRFSKISTVKAHTTEDFINKATKVHGDSYDYTNTSYDRTFKDVKIFCRSCEREFTQKASDHLSGCGCNLCTFEKQRQLYIFSVKDDKGNIVCIKAGRAVNYKTRLSRQQTTSNFQIELFALWETPSYEICKEAESVVIASIQGKYLPKEDYPDGYTETKDIKYLEDIMKIFSSYGERIV